jgi:hypothetical protein
MIAKCTCGSVFWAEPPLSCCPACDEPKLVRLPDEPVEAFTDRVAAYHLTRAEIRSLPELAPPPSST